MSFLTTWRDEFCRSLKAVETEEPFDLYCYRPLAFIVAKALSVTPASANMVSVASLLCGLATGGLFWQGTAWSLTLGAFFYFWCIVLDCADGQLARMRGSSSPLGYIIDGLSDYLATLAVYVGMAHALALKDPGHVARWWLVCTLWICSYGWQCAILDRNRHEWTSQVYKKRSDPQKEIDEYKLLFNKWKTDGTNLGGRALVAIYLFYKTTWAQIIPLASQAVESSRTTSRWEEHHRLPLRMSVMMGSSMQMTLIVLAALFDRFDLYLYLCLTIGNLWAAAILLLESQATVRLT